MQLELSRIERLGAFLVAISPETLPNIRHTVDTLGITFPLLSDMGNSVAKDFGIGFRLPDDLLQVYKDMGIDLKEANGDNSHELPMPATYIVGTDRIIKWAFVDPNHTNRAEPAEIATVLGQIA